MSSFSVHDISSAEVAFLADTFEYSTLYGYGHFPSLEEEHYSDEYYARKEAEREAKRANSRP